jgi:hypothetical protein
MRQALHIFRKDVRGSAYEIFVMLVLVTAFAVEGSGVWPQFGWLGFIIGVLPLSWWNLTASVIHAEAVPGDRQFWLTRPYSWKILLAGKISFLVVVIGPPMAIADAAILHWAGFPVVSNLGGILWQVVLQFLLLIVPAFVLATLTRSLAGFIASGLGVIVMIFFGAGLLSGEGISLWDGWGWVALAMVTVAVIFQYARHRKIAFALALCALLLPLISAHIHLPVRFPAKLMEPRAGDPALQFRLAAADQPPHTTETVRPGEITFELPVRVDGIPAGLDLRAGDAEVIVQSQDGRRSENRSPVRFMPGPHGSDANVFWETIPLPASVYDRVRSEPVQFYTRLDLTLYRPVTTLRIGRGPFEVPGVGRCWQLSDFLDCSAALRRPDRLLSIYDANGEQFQSQESVGVQAGLGPIVTFVQHLPREAATIVVAEPVAHTQRDFYLRDVVLDRYTTTRK